MANSTNFTQCICTGYCDSWILSLPPFITNSWFSLVSFILWGTVVCTCVNKSCVPSNFLSKLCNLLYYYNDVVCIIFSKTDMICCVWRGFLEHYKCSWKSECFISLCSCLCDVWQSWDVVMNISVPMYAQSCIHMHACTHMHAQTHIHTHTHINTHTCMLHANRWTMHKQHTCTHRHTHTHAHHLHCMYCIQALQTSRHLLIN